ncbi:cytochrome c family protein [Tropicimonas sp. IMCC34043]|uniref:c-type cytochrome n=1 Tax=Tropicimonas sp. IMCC34043 TaxID=2248760 RepID=UPI000E2322F3|nr:c-type cytochrome [Tropicimonas sp. IMCC34043]
MKAILWATAALIAMPLSAVAQGDAAAGEKVFKQCQTCHVVVNDAGETLAGMKAKVGPNLYGVPGRTAGTVEGFKYSKYMVEAGEAGLAWNEDDFVAYSQDPSKFLQGYLDDSKARGNMTFKVRKEEDARDVWAFLVSLSPQD